MHPGLTYTAVTKARAKPSQTVGSAGGRGQVTWKGISEKSPEYFKQEKELPDYIYTYIF